MEVFLGGAGARRPTSLKLDCQPPYLEDAWANGQVAPDVVVVGTDGVVI